ncbi:Crp/Fnr family transcriptional regulator [Jhaorihella thermophila]|uniref:cAMP-binding domain of CRP or a regulatory subunit of cAMP-dependent protein kinases n=1 Tax=Jhaorihella thermophila TaxID=488547 RepID=A0A1H5XPB8_9RHOB|nr:Crp/Fnr family transcriptional regulator [Jhaorihella thermophila]SEG13581.1 cAMP-binding domain of CRP or a regulatory subunit of cAMP-dependent protein kinases [Jhaorihella thermophila]
MTVALPEIGFLSQASDLLRQVMSEQASRIDLVPGEVLIEQGQLGDELFAIVEGAIEFSVVSADGRKLALDLMGPGAVFGEIALFDPGPRTATATAIKPTRVCRVRRGDVLAQLQRHPELAIDMIRLAGQRMRWMNSQLNEQVFLPMRSRLARKLLYLSDPGRDGRIALSQAELAEFVGATREAVSKALATWKRQGLVDVGRGEITILDRAALETLADTELL